MRAKQSQSTRTRMESSEVQWFQGILRSQRDETMRSPRFKRLS